MPDLVAKLELNASEYESGVQGVGRLTETVFNRVGKSVGDVGGRLGKLSDAGRRMGDNVAAGGKQAEAAVDGVGKHADTTGEKMEKAFGAMRWTRLVGMYALIRTGAAALEGTFAELAAHEDLSAAKMGGDYEGILRAQLEVVKANEQLAQSFPVLGGIIAKTWAADEKGLEQAITSEEKLTESLRKAEEQGVKMHQEAVLEKMKLDGKSDAEIGQARLNFLAFKETKELDALQEALEQEGKYARVAQQKLQDSRSKILFSPEEVAAHGPEMLAYEEHLRAFNVFKQGMEEKNAVEEAKIWQKSTEYQLAELEKRLQAFTAFTARLQSLAAAASRSAGLPPERTQFRTDAYDQKGGPRAYQDVTSMEQAEFADMWAGLEGHASGGYISGPSGIDTVPAWLTAGEFVVNASSARRNAGWLSAINEGVTLPGNAQRFASGGSVQQAAPAVHITANITVNPPPGSNPRDIARAVVDELARLKIRGRG